MPNRYTKDPQRGRDVAPFSLKFSEDERLRYGRAAKAAGQTLGHWVREACQAHYERTELGLHKPRKR